MHLSGVCIRKFNGNSYHHELFQKLEGRSHGLMCPFSVNGHDFKCLASFNTLEISGQHQRNKDAVSLEFLRNLSVETEFLDSLSIPEDVEIIKERLNFLESLGLDSVSTVNRCPPLIGCSVTRNFIPIIEFLKSIPLDTEEIKQILSEYPRILYFSVKIDIEPIMIYLQGLGLQKDEIGNVILRYPQILGFKVEGTLSTSVAFLVGLGVNLRAVSRIVLSEPTILGMKVGNNLLPKVNFFRGLMISDLETSQMIEVAPFVLTCCNLERMISIKEYFLSIGISEESLGKMLISLPDILRLECEILTQSIEIWIQEALDLEMPDLVKIVKKFPKFLLIRTEKAAMKVNSLRKCGFSQKQLGMLVTECPQVLGLKVEEAIIPRLDFLQGKMGRSVEELLDYPLFLLTQMEEIRQRQSYLEEAGITSCSLRWIFECTEEQFKKRLGIEFKVEASEIVEFEEGPEF